MGLINTIQNQMSGDNSDEELPWEAELEEQQLSNTEVQNTDAAHIKEHFLSALTTKRKAIIGLAVFCMLIVGFVVYNNATLSSSIQTTSSGVTEANSNTSNKQVRVYVSGCVNAPGVYTLDADMRIIDAINKAGGFSADAKQDALNLASTIKDGDQISVPSNTSSSSTTDTGGQSSTDSSGKININTADLTTLQQLSGVGPSTAQKIIDYRNANGKFKSIEEIKNVSGIGDKTYAKFSSQICV